MKLITINIKDLGRNVKWKYLTELIAKEKSAILCVQETKLVNISEHKCFNIWGKQ